MPHESLRYASSERAIAAHAARWPVEIFPNLALADRIEADRIEVVRERLTGRVVFTTSFGIEDQAIVDAIFTQDLAIDVVTFDTGRLFPETYDVWARTEDHYGKRVTVFHPEREHVEALVARRGGERISSFYRSEAGLLRCAQGEVAGARARWRDRLDNGHTS